MYHYSLLQHSNFRDHFVHFWDVFYVSTLGRWTFRPPSYPVSTWCFWSRSHLFDLSYISRGFRCHLTGSHGSHLQDVRDPERDYKLAKHLISLHKGSQHEEPALIPVISCSWLDKSPDQNNPTRTGAPGTPLNTRSSEVLSWVLRRGDYKAILDPKGSCRRHTIACLHFTMITVDRY